MKYFSVLILLASMVFGEVAGSWQIFADAHYSNCIASLDGQVFVGTKGGMVRYSPSTGISDILTNLDGLGDLNITGLALYNGRLFYAGANGSIGCLEGIRFKTNSDLKRSNISCNGLISIGEHLYTATTSGVSKLNILSGSNPVEIAENYTKLGEFDRNLPVVAVSSEGSLIWAATEDGLAYGNLESNLFTPDEWQNLFTNRSVTGIFADSGGAWFALERAADQPSIFWTNGEIIDTVADEYMNYRMIDNFFYYNDDFYVSGGSGLYISRSMENFDVIRLDEHWAVHGATSIDGELYVGLEVGFGVLQNDTIRAIHPNTPWGTGYSDLTFGPDGDVWLVAKNLGVMHWQNNQWDAFTDWTITTDDSLLDIIETGVFSSYSLTVDGNNALWIGTNGKGIFCYDNNGNWQVFNETNSVLRGIAGAPDVVVCRALTYDPYRSLLWVTNYAASNGLAVAAFDPNIGLDAPIVSYYSGSSGISTNNIHGIAVDETRVWLVLKDEGIAEISLGPDIGNTADDNIYVYSNYLPSSSVYQIALEDNGKAWVAADGGVANIDPSLGTVINGFLPEHVSLGVADVDIDPWNNVWIATDDGAAMYRNSDTTWHAIKSRASNNADFEEMTDLPTDYLYSVKVNPSNGDVWFLGEGAIGVLSTGFGGEDGELKDLLAFPNPFVWDGSATNMATISGVPSDADLHIYSSEGLLVRTLSSLDKGPTAAIEWNGRNDAGKPVASGIYILAAPSSRGTARGKIALLRSNL